LCEGGQVDRRVAELTASALCFDEADASRR
jgi:hypothetical protein